MISPNNRDRHRTGKADVNASGGMGGMGGMGGKNNAAWSESKPSGIDGLGPRLTNENRHPSVQVVRGSTNMDLSRDEEGATQDRSNAPITNTNDPEQVTLTHYLKPSLVSPVFPPQISETKCCCFFKRKMRKKKSGRSK